MSKSKKFGAGKWVALFVVGGLLAVPNALVSLLVQSREDNESQAVSKVSESWGRGQWFHNAIVCIPNGSRTTVDEDGNREVRPMVKRIIPDNVETRVELIPQERHVGIYNVTTYEAEVISTAKFPPISQREGARVVFRVSDMAGISNPKVSVNGKAVELGHDDSDFYFSIPSGVSVADGFRTEISFSLKGTRSFNFTPVARNYTAGMTGQWNSPLFDGKYAPSYTIGDGKFTAEWNITDLNSGAADDVVAQVECTDHNIYSAGVTLSPSVSSYEKVARAVNYGYLFIFLTFVIFVMVEVMTNRRVHPVQYLLVGLSLVVFYILLLAITEYTGFACAYLIAAGGTIGINALFALKAFADSRATLSYTGLLVALYSALFVICTMENGALISGAVLLFAVVALAMLASTRFDWYAENDAEPEEDAEIQA